MDNTSAPPRRLQSVDGLRAVAALAVVGFHLTWRSPTLRGGRGASVTGHFDTGVEVFFVLSGFLIFLPFARALAVGDRVPRSAGYALRRITRVFPGYLTALSLALLFGLVHVVGWAGLAKHGSLTYLYFEDRGGRPFPVAWTLVVEMSFYAFVPVLARLLPLVRDRLAEASLVVVAAGAYFQHLVAYDLHTARWVRVLPPALLSLGLGMLLAVVVATANRPGAVARHIRAVASRPVLPLAVAALAFAAMVVFIPAGTDMVDRPGDRFAKELLQAVVAAGIALPVLLAGSGPSRWRGFLSRPVTTYLGTVSYGIYLWHLPVLRQARPLLVSERPAVAVFGWALALGVTVVLASVSWYLVERPAMDAIARRLGRRPMVTGSPTG